MNFTWTWIKKHWGYEFLALGLTGLFIDPPRLKEQLYYGSWLFILIGSTGILIGLIGILKDTILNVCRLAKQTEKRMILLSLSILLGLGSITSAYLLWRECVTKSEYIEEPNNPLRITKPRSTNVPLIRTCIVIPEKMNNVRDSLYKNYYLIRVDNKSTGQKTVKDVNLKLWYMGKAKNCPIDDHKGTSIDLKPGGVALFRIAYDYSDKCRGSLGEQEVIPRQDFNAHRLNIKNHPLIFEHDSPHFLLLTTLSDPIFSPISYVFQLSADNISSQYFRVTIHPDNTLESGFYFETNRADGSHDDGTCEILAQIRKQVKKP